MGGNKGRGVQSGTAGASMQRSPQCARAAALCSPTAGADCDDVRERIYARQVVSEKDEGACGAAAGSHGP